MWSDRNKLVRKINLGLPVKSLSITGSTGDCLIVFEGSDAIRLESKLNVQAPDQKSNPQALENMPSCRARQIERLGVKLKFT